MKPRPGTHQKLKARSWALTHAFGEPVLSIVLLDGARIKATLLAADNVQDWRGSRTFWTDAGQVKAPAQGPICGRAAVMHL